VLYKADGGTQIRQTMRCASADYAINSLAELRIKGSQVSGTWEEKTYSAKGDVTGRFGGDSFALSIQGAAFSAYHNRPVDSARGRGDKLTQAEGVRHCWSELGGRGLEGAGSVHAASQPSPAQGPHRCSEASATEQILASPGQRQWPPVDLSG